MDVATKLPKSLRPFDMDRPLPSTAFIEERPTIVAVVRNQAGGVLLVLPQKAADEQTNAWIFPQGPIERRITPRQALIPLLQKECGIESTMVELSDARPLGTARMIARSGEVKCHYFVFLTLRTGFRPILSDVVQRITREIFFAGGPNCVWQKIADVRPEKRRVIAAVLRMAVDKKLLVTSRWQLERMSPFIMHAG